MNKFTALLTGTAIFILLFFNQSPGLNVSIFAMVIWGLSFLRNIKNANTSFFVILSGSCFLSAFSFAYYGDAISFFALFFSIVITAFFIQYPRLKTLILPIIAAINIPASPIRVLYFRYWLPMRGGREMKKKWLAMGIIPGLFVILFLAVYATGSDLFSGLLNNLLIGFDLGQFVVLGILGFLLLFNLWVLWIPRAIIRLSNSIDNNFSETEKRPLFRLPSGFSDELQRKSGEVTFTLLNILLLIFIVTYNYEQFFENTNAGNLSDEIHQRIATVIGSIALAIGLILFYFRSKSAMVNAGSLLRTLAFIWIVLNAFLVVSAFGKNGEYIGSFGLTFRRISVVIFLILCLIGLYLTWCKLARHKTNAFLINKMAWVFYFTLVILAPVNFSWVVTRFNIANGKNSDAAYLQSLSYNKKILYRYYKNDPGWKTFFDDEKRTLSKKQNEPLLSADLYGRFLKLE